MNAPHVHKFGGSSLADAASVREAVARLREAVEVAPAVVVVSATGDSTDALGAIADAAARGAGQAEEALAGLGALGQRHQAILGELELAPADAEALADELTTLLGEAADVIRGAVLTGELTGRTRDRLLATGEKLSARLLAAALEASGLAAQALDADTFLETDDHFGQAQPLGAVADRTLQGTLRPLLEAGQIPVVTGFCGRAPDGATTTLGRGGSDLTATLIAAALGAGNVTLWTDVDGVFSADPSIVPSARCIPQLNYREAAELSFYGATVLHQRTMIPVLAQGIPVLARNTFRPGAAGTVVDSRFTPGSHPVKAITAVRNHTLVSIEGKGMAGVPGVAARVFGSLAERGISVTMISQSSSEASICLAVPDERARSTELALKRALRPELARGDIEEVVLLRGVGLVAVVGLGMAHTPGVSARVFSALAAGADRVNVSATAQGMSELNITLAVEGDHVDMALRALHEEFGLHRRDTGVASPGGFDLILLGCGQIGRSLLSLIGERRSGAFERLGLTPRVVGMIDRSGYVLAPAGIEGTDLDRLQDLKAGGGALIDDSQGQPGDAEALLCEALGYRLSRPVLVDLSDGDTAACFEQALRGGCDVVTANKRPLAGPLDQWEAITAAQRDSQRLLKAEATVGAGLPVMDTLELLLAAGDRVLRAEGCLSGTLGFIFSRLEEGVAFSAAVKEALEQGYTEPDPVVDLAGTDMARKAVILGRLSGLAAADSPLGLEGLVDPALAGLPTAELLEKLKGYDDELARRRDEAAAKGAVLRFVAQVEKGKVTVGLDEVPADSPLGQLKGTDNMIVLTTERYQPRPLVVSGPGAGVEVTAMGVLGDILRVAAERS